jgi:predicted peptidase
MRQDFHRLHTTIDKTVTLRYLKHLPPQFWTEPDREWPLILYLHDEDARGSDINRVWDSPMPDFLNAFPDYPAIVLSPQCPVYNHDWLFYLDALLALLDDPAATRGVDRDRIILLGLGMGAQGAIRLAMLRPQAFAALVLVRANGDPAMLRSLRHIPAWFFHGEQDDTHPVANAVRLYRMHRNGQITTFSLSGRDIWVTILDYSNLLDWMLARRLGESNADGHMADVIEVSPAHVPQRPPTAPPSDDDDLDAAADHNHEETP